MPDISTIDKNFFIDNSIDEENTVFYDAKGEAVSLHGVFHENGCFRRLPESVGNNVNDGVRTLHTHTAGGRLRFMTDSPYIVLNATFINLTKATHMPFTASIGFDIYRDKIYHSTFVPALGVTDEGFTQLKRCDGKMHTYEINFPLYSGVRELEIGIKKGSEIKKAADYKIKSPVVYYGSSITQGGCASRPGTSYEAIIHRSIDADYINLGFSGSCRAEDAMLDYISNLDMSVFVYDYDHNAPTPEFLEKTHEPFYKKLRERRPDLPIIMVSAPTLTGGMWTVRREHIKSNYEKGVAAGDKNLYFVDGYEIFEGNYDCTVDGCHPTDLGFYFMAKHIGAKVKEVIEKL